MMSVESFPTKRGARGAWCRCALSMALVAVMVLLLGALVSSPLGGVREALAQQQGRADDTNPRANFWRAVRDGNQGYSAVTGPETGVLIQNGGENWRALRNGPLMVYGGWLLLGVAGAILLFYLVRGSVRLEGGRSGLTVPRWMAVERLLHWYTAVLFLALMVTGLTLLFGRELLIPLVGKDSFAAWAGVAKQLHNYLGPFFAAGLLLEILIWVRHNIPRVVDFKWFAKGGGLMGSSHASAGRMNGGEKLWFWLLATVGVVMVVSGFVLNFPNFEQTRGQMQLAHLVHSGSAIVMMAFALGHIYIGTLGSEGSLEGMVTGRVDAEWAKQHHDLWYQDLLEQGVRPEPHGGTAPAESGRPRRVEPKTS